MKLVVLATLIAGFCFASCKKENNQGATAVMDITDNGRLGREKVVGLTARDAERFYKYLNQLIQEGGLTNAGRTLVPAAETRTFLHSGRHCDFEPQCKELDFFIWGHGSVGIASIDFYKTNSAQSPRSSFGRLLKNDAPNREVLIDLLKHAGINGYHWTSGHCRVSHPNNPSIATNPTVTCEISQGS